MVVFWSPCVFLLLLAVLAPAAVAQDAAAQDGDLPPPWELTRLEEGTPPWAPLLRLREAEVRYRESEQWWGTYAQYRAQLEAAIGNNAAALAFWDAPRPPRDSVGVLPTSTKAADAVAFLAAAADTARVLMINERHHAASDRILTLRLLPVLHERGYRYLAAEAFGYADTTLNERSFPVEATGHYTNEPVFGALIREALRLGYTLVPYEVTPEQQEAADDRTPQQRRDRAQAQNLARVVADDPDAKVLVHAGFAHVEEEASKRWYPMALYFREITGIDPVTVDQTNLSERSAPGYEHPAYRAAAEADLLSDEPIVLIDTNGVPVAPAASAVDVQVLAPRTSYAGGRPAWMTFSGRRVPVDLAVPECADRWCYVEARRPAERPDAVALDRAEVEEAGTVRLFLPPGEAVEVRVVAADGTILRTMEHAPRRPAERR